MHVFLFLLLLFLCLIYLSPSLMKQLMAGSLACHVLILHDQASCKNKLCAHIELYLNRNKNQEHLFFFII